MAHRNTHSGMLEYSADLDRGRPTHVAGRRESADGLLLTYHVPCLASPALPLASQQAVWKTSLEGKSLSGGSR